jgi:lysozyme
VAEISARIKAATVIATALAIPAEGIRQYAYFDPPGILTVCRGHTGPDVVARKKYSVAECDAFMSNDMRAAIARVERCAPGLPPHVLAAFGDAVFNMGPRIACDKKNSTAARLLAAGRIPEACEQLSRWDKASVAGQMVSLPGLTKRRAKERDLCLTGELA